MKKQIITLLSAIPLCMASAVCSAEPDQAGVIRNVNHADKVVTIDEIPYRSAPNLEIRNFAGGTDTFDSIEQRMRARYSVDEFQQLTELWLYSRNRNKVKGIEDSIGDNNH